MADERNRKADTEHGTKESAPKSKRRRGYISPAHYDIVVTAPPESPAIDYWDDGVGYWDDGTLWS